MTFLQNFELFKIASHVLSEKKSLVIRSFFVSIVLVISIFFIPRFIAGDTRMVLLFLSFAALVGIVIFLRWPVIGLFLAIAGGMFLPFSWQGGFNASEIGIASTLAIGLLSILIFQQKIQIRWSNTFLPFIVFGVASIISFGFGQFSWYPFAQNAPLIAQLGGLSINLLSIGAFFAVILLITDLRKLKFLTWTFIGLGLLYILGRFLKLSLADRVYQLGFTAGSLFWTWLVALLAGQILLNRHLSYRIRLILSIFLVMTLYVAISQAYDWKSGWVPPVSGLMVIVGIRYWRQLRFFSPLAVIPIYYIIVSSIGSEDYSVGTRLDAWKIVLQIAQISPIMGMGFGNYYWYTPLFPIRGWYVRFNSHSQYVDLIAQTGYVGLICFSWIFFEIIRLGFSLRQRVPDGFAKGYVYGAIGGLVGTLVAGWLVDWVLPFSYNIGMNGFRASVLAWLFMGGLAAIEQIVHRQSLSNGIHQ